MVHTEVGIRCPDCAGVPRSKRRGFVATVLSWLVLLPLWRTIFRPRPLQWGCATVTGLVVVFVALVISGGALVGFSTHPRGAVSTAPAVAAVATPEPATGSSGCGPNPCATVGGVTLSVSTVNLSYHPPGDQLDPSVLTPQAGFHFVRLEVVFHDVSGEHEVSPFDLNLKDALGYQQAPELGGLIPGCQTASEGALAAGGTLGPTPVCFQAGGPIDGRLTLIWIPPGLTGTQESAVINLP